MLPAHVRTILIFLNSCRAHTVHAQRPFLGLTERLGRRCFWASITMFIPALCVAGWARAGQPVSDTAQLAGAVSGLLGLVLLLIALCFPIIAAMSELRHWRDDTLAQLLGQFDTEATYVQTLLKYSTEELKHAHLLLSQKVARYERRVTLIAGDKIAVLTLVIMGFSSVQVLSGFETVRRAFAERLIEHPLNLAPLLGLAILVGFALGSLLLKMLNDRHRYEIELLDRALHVREVGEGSA